MPTVAEDDNPVTLTTRQAKDIEARLRKFINKVETGKARSVETYKDAIFITNTILKARGLPTIRRGKK